MLLQNWRLHLTSQKCIGSHISQRKKSVLLSSCYRWVSEFSTILNCGQFEACHFRNLVCAIYFLLCCNWDDLWELCKRNPNISETDHICYALRLTLESPATRHTPAISPVLCLLFHTCFRCKTWTLFSSPVKHSLTPFFHWYVRVVLMTDHRME